MKSTDHCIVTPDFIGPIKNGGIGTACFHLAKFISKDLGEKVTILFTGPVIHGSAAGWRRHYSDQQKWEFLCLEDVAPAKNPLSFYNTTPWFLEQSFRIDQWLRNRQFNSVHFQDWHANGFCAVQAKAQGIAHQESLFTCTVHSPQAWIDEGGRSFGRGGVEGLLQNYNERYAACSADVTIFPSKHMQHWSSDRGWRPRNGRVIQYIFDRVDAAKQPPSKVVDELCFFGRLETRKGLELFVGAIERLLQNSSQTLLPPLTFIGKIGMAGGKSADRYLLDFSRQRGVAIKLLTNFDSDAALKYLTAAKGRVAVIASLQDNLPLTVIECLDREVRLLAARSGGIPELVVSDKHLFEATPAGLANKLAMILQEGIEQPSSGFNPSAAKDMWAKLLSESHVRQKEAGVTAGDITVCVAYFNYGNYLPKLLESLEKQSQPGFGVVVVNDGSTDEFSNRVFESMAERYSEYNEWKFLTQTNAGIGATRNFAASQARTDYVAFMDADNEAEPLMVEHMARAMTASGADCLTCYMRGFEEAEGGDLRRECYAYLPTGGCAEAGVFANVFGDANFIIKSSAFKAVGGFSEKRDASHEDWELLARLVLGGYKLDVIPEFLFRYRHTNAGFSRNTSKYLNHKRIVQVYERHLPAWGGAILEAFYKTANPVADDHAPRGLTGAVLHYLRQKCQFLPLKFKIRLRSIYRWARRVTS
jgi:glycosyltransferase involved in cell wall biosynthesis